MEYTDKKFGSLLLVSGGLFILLYLILSFHTRLASDDFFYLGLEHHLGGWKGMMYQYENWSGRWTAHFVAISLLQFSESKAFLPMICIITFLGLFIPLQSALKKINAFNRLESRLSFGLTLAFLTAFFFSSFNIGESWFWYIIIITYLWSLVAFLISLNAIFSENKIHYYLIILIFCTYIGGASESFALIFLFSLIILICFSNKIFHSRKYNSHLIFAIVVILISFSFSYFAPGTSVRQSMLPNIPISEKVIIYFKSIAKYFIYFLPKKFPYLILFSAPWFFYGSKFLINKTNIFQSIKNVSIIFFALLFIAYIPTVYVMSDAGPDRALLIVSFITSIYFSILFAFAGTYFKIDGIVLSRIVFVITCLVLLFHSYDEYYTTRDFVISYDNRMVYLKDAKNEKTSGVVNVVIIPPPGMLYWEELSKDTTFFTNKHLKSGLDLPFSVRLK